MKKRLRCFNCGKYFWRENQYVSGNYARLKNKRGNYYCSKSCAAISNNKITGARGPYRKNDRKELYERSIELRKDGLGYRSIAAKVGVSWGTVRNWVRSIPAPDAHALASKAQIKNIELCAKKAVREKLISLRGYFCEECHLNTWLGKPITLEHHHINGNKKDNREKNLKILCPNCHSQTSNYRSVSNR